jgi:hypothetical protein
MASLWILTTLIAAAAQTVRNTVQRNLTGPLGTVGGAIAGSHDQIIDTLRDRIATPSATDHDELANVTVLCIEGDAAQQSVTNVARVAMIGRALTNPGGAVVIIADTDHLDREAAHIPL